jgi:hypothetical protein
MSFRAYNEKVLYIERGSYFDKFRSCYNLLKSDENGSLSGFIVHFSSAGLVGASKKGIDL